MKKLLLAVGGMLFAATSFAQNALVASLSHGTTTTYYYGVTALKQAVEAAASGDIINLSSGSFDAIDISKGITLRGAGIDSEAPTYIVNGFTIEIPSEDANRFMMEGIRCTDVLQLRGAYSNPYFVKCQFTDFSGGYYDTDAITNAMLANCKITKTFDTAAGCTYSLVNCIITHFTQYGASTTTAANCVYLDNGFHVSSYRQSQFSNCIFVSLDGKGGYNDASGNTNFLPTNSQAKNCIAVNFPPTYDPFQYLPVQTDCKTSLAYTDVFKTFTGTYSDTETFELTETAKTTYVGTDGKEVGLYGGFLPFSSKPSYPVISSLTADPQTDESGTLNNVKVVVSNPE